jgi:hypothetical protein
MSKKITMRWQDVVTIALLAALVSAAYIVDNMPVFWASVSASLFFHRALIAERKLEAMENNE